MTSWPHFKGRVQDTVVGEPGSLGYHETRDMFRQHKAKWPELGRCGVWKCEAQLCQFKLRFQCYGTDLTCANQTAVAYISLYEIDFPGRHSSAAAVNSKPVQTPSAHDDLLSIASSPFPPNPHSSHRYRVSCMFPFRLSTPILAAVSMFMFYAVPRPSAVTRNLLTMHQDQ